MEAGTNIFVAYSYWSDYTPSAMELVEEEHHLNGYLIKQITI